MRAFGITDIGRARSVNQDYVYASEKPVGRLPNLFVVADGMGGHNAGDRASSCAVDALLKQIRKKEREKNPVNIIRRAIDEANRKVYEESRSISRYSGMGTTMVAATIVGSTLYVANVGDSRLYLIDDEIRQITRDHSLVEEMIRAGGITREQGRNHPDKNVITRAVGVDESVEVDFFNVELKKDARILLCTDGLSNMVTDSRIEEIIREEKDVKAAGRRLVEAANENGGLDNITVLIVSMQTDGVKA